MGKSKRELAAELKRIGLQGDQARSLAMGKDDPRHRRGPGAAIASGLRYNQDQFEVDADGRLNLKNGGVTIEKIYRTTRTLIEGGGGTVPAISKRLDCIWRRHSSDVTAPLTTGNSDVMGILPGMSSTADPPHYINYHGIVPPDADATVTWTANVGIITAVPGVSGAFVIDVDIYVLDAGDDYHASGGIETPEASIQITGSIVDNEDVFQGVFSQTIPADTFDTDTDTEFFVRVVASTLPGQILITGLWFDYTTATVATT